MLHVCDEENIVEVCVAYEASEVVLFGSGFGEELLAGDFGDGVDLCDCHFGIGLIFLIVKNLDSVFDV